MLALEATVAASIADKAVAFAPLAHRLRVMGSLALSLCYLAAGRVDAVCSLKEARAVDIAAAQLLLHEVGLPIIFVDAGPFGEGPLDTAARSPVAAAGDAGALRAAGAHHCHLTRRVDGTRRHGSGWASSSGSSRGCRSRSCLESTAQHATQSGACKS